MYKSIKDFEAFAKLKCHYAKEFSHIIIKVTKKIKPDCDPENSKYQHVWYLKMQSLHAAAMTEEIAQEFFRLILPRQPKTRLVLDKKNQFNVVSKEVPGYQVLVNIDPEEFNVKIKLGEFKGLGEILVLALFLNEIDLRQENLCLNENNEVVKIDGELCFADFYDNFNDNYEINVEDLKNLPYLKHYQPHNWLDLLGNKKRLFFPKLVDQITIDNEYFRHEINQTILKIIVLPASFLKAFVEAYVVYEDGEDYYGTLFERQNNLRKEALKLESFKKYVESSVAQKDLEVFINELKNFKCMKQKILFNQNFKQLLRNKFEILVKEVQALNQTPLLPSRVSIFKKKPANQVVSHYQLRNRTINP